MINKLSIFLITSSKYLIQIGQKQHQMPQLTHKSDFHTHRDVTKVKREKDLSLSWLLLRNKCLLYALLFYLLYVLPLVLWSLRSLYPSPVTFVYLANKQQIAVTAVVSHKQNCFFRKKTGLLISKVPCFKVKSPVLTF